MGRKRGHTASWPEFRPLHTLLFDNVIPGIVPTSLHVSYHSDEHQYLTQRISGLLQSPHYTRALLFFYRTKCSPIAPPEPFLAILLGKFYSLTSFSFDIAFNFHYLSHIFLLLIPFPMLSFSTYIDCRTPPRTYFLNIHPWIKGKYL